MESKKSKVCPVDGRRFATASALAQHRMASHGGAVKSQPKQKAQKGVKRAASRSVASAPLALKSYAGPQNASTIVVSGSDLLASLAISARSPAGTIIADLVINPRQFEGTRLTQQSRLYTRWRPRHMELVVQSTLPTTAGGQIVMGWAADPKEDWPSDPTALSRKVMMMRPSAMVHLWEIARLRVPTNLVQTWLYCHDEGPDSNQGKVVVVLSGAPVSITGTFNVTITLNWTVEFQSPDMPLQGGDVDYVRAEEGFYPYFTTGSKFLGENNLLTVECESAGGANSIVRFRGLEYGVVYEPVVPKQLLYYKDKDTVDAVGAIVKVRDITEPYVYCFATAATAASYAKSGDLTNALTYYKAGDWCAGNPLWKKKAATALLSNGTGKLVVSDTPQLPINVRVHDREAAYSRDAIGMLVMSIAQYLKNGATVNVNSSIFNPVVVRNVVPVPGEAMESGSAPPEASTSDAQGIADIFSRVGISEPPPEMDAPSDVSSFAVP